MAEAATGTGVEAEQSILAAMIASPQAVEEIVELIRPDDFSTVAHRDIFRCVVSMTAADEPVDRLTLRAWMRRDQLHPDAEYLNMLARMPSDVLMAKSHAEMVAEAALRRNISRAAARLAELSTDEATPPKEIIVRAQAYMDDLARSASSGRKRALSIEEFLAIDTVRSAPVVPGLLDHQDRVVVVATEGAGKTVLAHQVALTCAAGLHPFSRDPIPPVRVLVIDFENPIGILQRRLRPLLELARMSPAWPEGDLRMYAEPGGVNLLDPRDAFDLADVIRQVKPDLIVGGPVYKMFSESENDGPAHAAITGFFDVMRSRYGCAVWLETHAPIQSLKGKRNMRPVGSGRWTRWPEFGIAFVFDKDPHLLTLQRFKGDREEGRSWPDQIYRNPAFRPCWPWLPKYPPGTFNGQLDRQEES